jgi:hypothetical protein
MLSEPAEQLRTTLEARRYASPSVASPIDQVATEMRLTTSEVDLLWLLACCECDPALRRILQTDHERPAICANVALRLINLQNRRSSPLAKIAVRRMYADGLIEGTDDFRLRLALRLVTSLRQ